ncbi:hypothetical protein J6590_106095, partial [Homalodisca vitripennis]
DATGQGNQGSQGKVREKKTGLEIREKSGNPVSSQGKVREFRRWSGKNIKSLYTNKLTAAAPSPSLQTTRRMKQAAEVARLAHPLIAKNPGDCVEKSQGKMKNLVWKSGKNTQIKGSENSKELLYQLTDILWKLHAVRPSNIALASVCVPGLTHVEAAAHCIVEIIHAFTLVDSSDSTVSLAVRLYLSLLLCQDTSVSFSAKQAFIRVLRPRLKRRRVYIPSPPHCSTPGAVESEKAGPVSQPSQESSEADQAHFEVDAVEPMVLLAPDAGLFSTIV